MPDVNATEASRNFSRLLDDVEHKRATYRIVRHGHAIAQISPVSACSGAQLKRLLSQHRPDRDWRDELTALRDVLKDQPRWS
ncbi:hypothetical protein BH20ACT9_BH20ACT9_09110 [soil metagenome]